MSVGQILFFIVIVILLTIPYVLLSQNKGLKYHLRQRPAERRRLERYNDHRSYSFEISDDFYGETEDDESEDDFF